MLNISLFIVHLDELSLKDFQKYSYNIDMHEVSVIRLQWSSSKIHMHHEYHFQLELD